MSSQFNNISMIPPPEAVAGECPSTSTIPVVALDVDILTDTVASRLATSLLGHVLYLKNQIPFPIVQLARMTNRKGNTKAAKMKTDLLSSFDTLASHLVTTFSALSSALAKAKASSSNDDGDDLHVSRAYMAILVGPSLGTARSKVLYGVDNFATHVWGTRDDDNEADEEGSECPEDSEDDEGDDSSDDESPERTGSEEDAHDDDDVDNGESLEQETKDEIVEECEDPPRRQENGHDYPPPPHQLHQSYAEEQRFLHAADRLLARVLASADTDGYGISNEMSPSQIHILLRAPRRFVHPVWVPRQNIQKQMEATLTDFINQSWPPPANDHNLSTKKKKSVEGVWVTPRNGLRGPPMSINKETNVPEEDEMIWWSWDGKLVGFADW